MNLPAESADHTYCDGDVRCGLLITTSAWVCKIASGEIADEAIWFIDEKSALNVLLEGHHALNSGPALKSNGTCFLTVVLFLTSRAYSAELMTLVKSAKCPPSPSADNMLSTVNDPIIGKLNEPLTNKSLFYLQKSQFRFAMTKVKGLF